jgi:negative regulator of flagellin synthesis FlgM
MKIPEGIQRVSGIYNKNSKVNKTEKTTNASRKIDEVSISNKAIDYQIVSKALKDVPDIRQDKVNQLMDKYSSGVSNEKGIDISEKMLKSTLGHDIKDEIN